MTACRSSFFLDETRSSSPWTCARTPFGPSSRMILEIFLALSWVMPSLRADADPVLLAGQLRLAGVERLEGDPALDQLVLEHVEDGLGPLLAVGAGSRPLLAGPGDRRADAAEVEPGADLLGGLVQRVVDFLAVDLADRCRRRTR